MYIFKYIQGDNTIYRKGSYVGTYAEFMDLHPNFPLVEGDFFEYSADGLDLINLAGHHSAVDDLALYKNLITAINNLGE